MKLLKAKIPYKSDELIVFKKSTRLVVCEFYDRLFLTDGSLLIQDSMSNIKWVFDKLNRPIEIFDYIPHIKEITDIDKLLTDKTPDIDTEVECVEYNNQIFAYDKNLVQILKRRSESIKLIQMNNIVCLAGYTTQRGLTVILYPVKINDCEGYSVKLKDEVER